MKNIDQIVMKYHSDKNGNPQSIHIVKKYQVSPIYNQILLEEIPDEFRGVSILSPENMHEVFNFDEIESNSYYVSDKNIVYFDKSMANKEVLVDFHGIGVELIDVNRVYTVLDNKGNVVETLGDIIDKGEIVLEAVKTIGDVVVVTKQLQNTINEAKEVEQQLSEDIRIGTPLDLALKEDIKTGQPLLEELKPIVETGVELNKSLPTNTDIANKSNETLQSTIKTANNSTKELNVAINEASQLKDIKLDVEKRLDEIKDDLNTTKISITESERSIGVNVKNITDPIISDIKLNKEDIKQQMDKQSKLDQLLQDNVKKIEQAESKITPTAIMNSVNASLTNGEVLGGTSTILDKDKFTVKDVDTSKIELSKGNITAYNENGKKTYYLDDSEIGICAKDNSDPLGILTSVYKKDATYTSKTYPFGDLKGVGLLAGDYAQYLTLAHDTIWGDDTQYDEYISFNKLGWAHVGVDWDFNGKTIHNISDINRHQVRPLAISDLSITNNQINTNKEDGILWLNYGKGIDCYKAKQDDISVRIGRGWGNGQHGQLVCQDLWVHGSKHNIVNTKELGFIGLHAYEMAEPQYGDNGGGIINSEGYCYVYIDPIFQKTINTNIEYRVIITIISDNLDAKAQCCEKMPNYFKVIGTPNTKFDWEVKCKRKNYETNRLDRTNEKVIMKNEINEENLSHLLEHSINNKNKNEDLLMNTVALSHINKKENIKTLETIIKNTNKNNLLLED